jgi:hypothetical protein
MSTPAIICPVCSQFDQVEKVSTIYLEGIGANRLPLLPGSAAENPRPPAQRLTNIPMAELRALSRRLAPPSSGKAPLMRPIHPDLFVLVFSCVIPIFLFGILIQQDRLFVPILVVLAGFYGLYFYKRKAAIAKYERDLAAKREAQERVEQGIKTWMNLYYCDRDKGVFLPGKRELIPLDRMVEYLEGGRQQA